MTSDRTPTRTDSFHNRKIVVTGASGFVGTHLVRALLEQGAFVVALDDGSNSDPSVLADLIDSSSGRLRVVVGSTLDPISLAEAMEGSDSLVHLAALVSVAESLEEPSRYTAVNAMGTAAALAAAKRAGVGRVVYASSAAVYGDAVEMPVREQSTLAPTSPYAASKLAGEHVVMSYARTLDLPGVSLRFFNVFGEGQQSDRAYASVVPAFVDSVLCDTRPSVFGDGEQTRDFVHVSNVVQAIVGLLLRDAAGDGWDGRAFNVGCGVGTTINDLALTIARLAGKAELQPEQRPARAGDVRHSVACIDHSVEVLGYRVETGLEEGLRRTIESMRGRDEQGGAPKLRLAE